MIFVAIGAINWLDMARIVRGQTLSRAIAEQPDKPQSDSAAPQPENEAADDEDKQAASDVIADTVYTNGKIYTVNEAQPWVDAVAIKDGKFIAVGSTDDVAAVNRRTFCVGSVDHC